MSDTIYPWGNTRRYNAYAQYFKAAYGTRLQKLSLDAGFTCPNRDGSVAFGGCAYCNNDSFNPSYCEPQIPIKIQLETGIAFHARRYPGTHSYLAYFQAFSNTYAPLAKLKELYSEALSVPGVVGLVIGTRPDCVDEEKLDYIAELSKQYFVSLEFGIESCYDKTLEYINRGHSFQTAVDAIEQSAQRGIHTGAHLLFGFPTETREEMLAQATIISRLPLKTVKFHQLQITTKTRFESEYRKDPDRFQLFGLDEYIAFIIKFVEQLNPGFIIERFASEAPPAFKIAPDWGGIRNEQLVSKIERAMEQQDTWQGKFWTA